MKLINKLLTLLGIKKEVPLKRLTITDYDKLVDSKVQNIRNYVKSRVTVKDDDADFAKKMEDAFWQYQENIRLNVAVSHQKWVSLKRDEILLSPIQAFMNTHDVRKKHVTKRNFLGYIRSIRWYYNSLKNKIGIYYRHMLLMREINKVKKLFPDYKLSNERALNLINAVKPNKKIINLDKKRNKKADNSAGEVLDQIETLITDSKKKGKK